VYKTRILAWKKAGLTFVSVGSEERKSETHLVSNLDSAQGVAPKCQRTHSVGTPEVPAEMSLVGKSSFGRYAYDREIFFYRRQKLLSMA
jgi:hypothetical protein